MPAPFDVLQAKPASLASDALTVKYFGTTTLLFGDGTDSILVDGFFSRPGGVVRLALGAIESNDALIASLFTKGEIPAHLKAVLVTHDHHDHALDSAVVASRTHAPLVGTSSTRRLAQAQLPTAEYGALKFKEVGVKKWKWDFGAFRVQALPAIHSPMALCPGEVKPNLAMPTSFCNFKVDKVYSYIIRHDKGTALVSSGMPEQPQDIENLRPDVVFLSIGGIRRWHMDLVREYWDKVVVTSKAKVVVPTHWDDFSKPIEPAFSVAPFIMGDFEHVMRVLTVLAARDGVTIRLLPAATTFGVKSLAD